MGSVVRMAVGANKIKRALNDRYGMKLKSIAKDRQLNRFVARAWADRVTRFVPRSDLPEERHHLQVYDYSDNRIKWYRHNENGDEIASMLYDGSLIGRTTKSGKTSTYHYHVRSEGATDYGPHSPRPYWDKMVQPGTTEWDEFIEEIQPAILDAIAKGTVY